MVKLLAIPDPVILPLTVVVNVDILPSIVDILVFILDNTVSKFPPPQLCRR